MTPRCVFPYALSACTHTPHDRTSPYTRAPPGAPRPLSLHVARPRHPSSSPHPPSPPPPQRNRNWAPDPLDVISVTSSSDSPPPPPRRSARKSKIQTPQFMAHVLVPSLPPGARKSDYAPVKQRPRTRDRRTAKGKARAGDNSGSNELMHVLQNAFESNWYGPGSTNTSPREKRKKRRTKKKPAKEIVVVDDDEDEEEGEKEKEKANLPTSLDQALATAFSLNSANPNVAATASTSAQAQGHLWPVAARDDCGGMTRAESLSDSASVEVVITSPTKRPRTRAPVRRQPQTIPRR